LATAVDCIIPERLGLCGLEVNVSSLDKTEELTMDPTAGAYRGGNNPKIPILTLAALLCDEFSIEWVLGLSDEKPSAVLALLEEAIQQNIIHRANAGSYAFTTFERRSGCLSSLSRKEKLSLRRQLAKLIRERFPDDAAILPVLAYQLREAADSLDDFQALYETGEGLRKAYFQTDALECYAKIIGGLAIHRGDEADRIFVSAVERYARLFSIHDDPKWIIGGIRSAISRAEGTGMRPFLVLLKMHLAKFEWYRGRQTAAIRQFNDGWSLAQASENPDTRWRAMTFRMFFFFWQGRYKDVVQVYDESNTTLSRYPRSKFPIMTTSLLGESLAFCGRVAEGLGMLDGLRDHCLEIGDTDILGGVLLSMTCIFLEIDRPDQALEILSGVRSSIYSKLNDFSRFLYHRNYAVSLAIKRNYAEAVQHIGKIADLGVSLFSRNIFIRSEGFIQMAVEMERDEFHRLSGQTPEQIIQSALKSRNVFERAMGHLYKARILMKQEDSPKGILSSLKQAEKWLKVSGNELQLAYTRLQIARVCLKTGDRIRGKREVHRAHRILSPISPSLIPEDLSALLDEPPIQQSTLSRILALGQEIVAIRDHREVLTRILGAIHQLTGAERGGIFLVEEGNGTQPLTLRAAKNLTSSQVARPDFQPSMDLICRTISSGTGQILKPKTDDETGSKSHDSYGLRSCICVPMVLRGDIIGALYHDNRFFDNPIKEADLEVLSFLAGQAAIALENARAYEEIQQLNRQLAAEKQYYMEKDLQRSQFKNFIGNSLAMQHVFDQISRVADQDTVVLIQGETGVGKELVARTIQNQSHRKEKAFITADCSALSETIITSELFGHERGAFTGAQSRRIGRFELAHGGTLFLDEIGNTPLDVQVRLLRVLQTREFQRVGGIETIRSDFRLITATNRDLNAEVAAGRFRADLYYRLNVFPITVPPLRERKEDIPLLALHFLRIYSTNAGKPFDGIPKPEMEKLLRYSWPGNVRELQSVIERGVILSAGPRFIVPELADSHGLTSERRMMTLAENERRHILWVLEQTGGTVGGKNGAARRLGVPDSTLFSRMKKLGIMNSRNTI